MNDLKIIELETVDSTNTYAKDLARKGAVSGTVVWAHTQTAGKGRQGNVWKSPLGNLYMSMILLPRVKHEHIGQLSFLSAVALSNVFEKMMPEVEGLQLKWPNDVLMNEKKLAGILLETESEAPWVVVGVGVNISNAPEGAVSLYHMGVQNYESSHVLDLLSQEIKRLVNIWETEGFSFIRESWLKKAYKLKETIKARLPKETVTGVFEGIDAEGALQLKMSDGQIKTIHSGEVFL